MKKKLTPLATVAVMLLGGVGFLSGGGGSTDFEFTHLSLGQGLSQVSIRCILRDRKGFMWFGTQDGLNKYDGYDFTVYKHAAGDGTTLSGDNIRAIIADREDGALWIATRSSGINRFDPATETFTRFRHHPAVPHSLSHDEVFSLYQDRQGVLWVGTWGGGINKFDKKTGTFTHYKNRPGQVHSLSGNIVRAILEDREGVLWIGTYDGGLNKFDREKEQFIAYRHDPDLAHTLSDDRIMTVFEDKAGVLWVGTDGGGLNAFDPQTGEFTRYRHDPRDPGSLGHDRIRAIYEDTAGAFWVGTYGGGINIFDRESGKFVSITHDPQVPNSLSDNQVMCIYEDNTRLIWLGTNSGGISLYDPHQKKFKRFTHYPKDHNSLSSPFVRAFVEDAEGVLWIGTNDRGLNKFDRENHTFTHYLHDPHRPDSLPHDRVYALYEDREQTLWVGTFGGGLCAFDRTDESFTHYKHRPHDPHSLSHDQVRSICEDGNGTLWVGAWNGGLNKFDREKGSFTRYTHQPDDPHSLSRDYVITLYTDRSGVLWVGAWGGGINRYNPTTDNFTRYLHERENPNSLSSNNVFCIYEDRTGVFWVGTEGKGLNKFNPKENRWTCYSGRHGLSNETVYGILEDERGNLWLSTNQGLSRFNPRTETSRNYWIRDGLQSNEFNAGAFYKNRRGEMFFGGINGFNAFYPREIKDNPYLPPVVVTDFKKFNRSVKFPESVSNLEEIRLSYRDNFIAFDFVALNYRVPEKNRYAYKLEGFDKDWIYCGYRRSAGYTNLSGGAYVFKVKASNNDGVWNREGASIRLVVSPPVWQTWWFQASALVILLLMIFSALQLRTHSIRKRNRQLEEMNTKLNEQIEERKQVEAALQASEKKYRRIVEESIHVLYQADMEGKLLMLSPSGVKLTGYDSVDEMLGRDIAETFYYNPADREAFLGELQKHGKVHHYEIMLKRRDGTPVPAETSSHFFYDAEGNPAGVEGILQDLTEKKRAEDEKLKLQEQLLGARKMEAVGTLAGGMAHEFNNLMAVVIGSAQLMQNDLPHDSLTGNRAQAVLAAARRCAELTAQLLSFSRRQMLKLETLDLNRLITLMEAEIRQALGDKIEAVIRLTSKPLPVRADPELMTRSIMIVVENARDAMPDGGTLTIGTGIEESRENRGGESPLSREGNFACLTVADTGVGMDEETLQHIFEPFFTTKQVGEGTGLGLSFAYGTVGQHKGWIDVTSAPGRGTAMKIYLPLSDSPID